MIIKYKGKSGKRSIKTCENCSCEFETLDVKIRSKGERFCSSSCYREFRRSNKQNSKLLNVYYQKKNKYGLTKDQYIKMLEDSQGKCKICNKERELCVDHDHNTLKVRGLICHNCNKMLGLAEDNIEILSKAIKYLGSSSNG